MIVFAALVLSLHADGCLRSESGEGEQWSANDSFLPDDVEAVAASPNMIDSSRLV